MYEDKRISFQNLKAWIAIGDTHSNLNELSKLLVKIQRIGLGSYKLIFLGDYFHTNPDFGIFLKFLKNIEFNFELVIGNHDLEFFRSYSIIKNDSIKKAIFFRYFSLDIDLFNWFSTKLVSSIDTDSAFFSHSGISDSKNIEDQSLYDLTMSAFREDLNHMTNKLIVQGHIQMTEVTSFGNHWFIDTGWGYGGRLSSLIYPSLEIISSN
ncbi:calcineurin-like phosphoesterase family protein [Leptospira meyeri]|uniref:Calcineurin-like phosphoesterase family protein n=1 Tax=Leptospira meyeri TaxID=29508 RepID=A0A4R8MQ15_LEPME|nr:metallophosphoesterase [Leptospira meyeri]EKJ85584.1 calcineurin-like phosphoesterase family protein [Leptospira meyeri serovar Hardjo str. Went 5]TDY71340.1 calcineurin-like phosphoesterase family protein [Leptospira meyeri]